MKIEDGKGSGRQASVDHEHRIMTDAQTTTALALATIKGDAFWVATDFIALTTTGSFSGLCYLKNSGTTRKLTFHKLRVCGTNIQQVQWIKKPSTGTLISGGTTITPENLNSASSAKFLGTAKKGADALTVTDGTLWSQMVCEIGHCEEILDGALILGPDDAIAVVTKPSVAGTYCAAFLVSYGNGDE